LTLAVRSPCSDIDAGLQEVLRDVLRMQMGRGLDHDSELMGRARERAEGRFRRAGERRREAEEELEALKAGAGLRAAGSPEGTEAEAGKALLDADFSGKARRLEQEIEELGKEAPRLTRQDLEEALGDLERRGLIDPRGATVRLTSKGAQALGRGFLGRILTNLARRGLGPHRVEEAGHGPWPSPTLRPYEAGDPYDRVNIERSLLATLERGSPLSGLRAGDFRVHEPRHSTEAHFGVLVDQSASMREKGKLEAAVETALALSELMRLRFPEDRLRVYAFSEEVREMEPWRLPGIAVPMKFIDIRAALRAFRKAVAQEAGNRQAHLITDSAPNFEDGEFVGFTAALKGVLEEARLYRVRGMVLNIIMLDRDPELREMAKRVARENLGRVFFADPGDLEEAVVEDYLASKRDLISL